MLSSAPAYDELDRRFPGRLQVDVPLASRTTFGIGGAADRLLEVEDEVLLAEVLGAARELSIPTFLLGGGSNLLIDDAGLRALVLVDRLRRRDYDGRRVRVEAGFGFHDLIEESVVRGLGGLEFAAGIPGTVGGAVWGNAGCYGQSIGDFLVRARWIDPDGRVREVGPEAFGFAYRESELKRNGCVLIDALLELDVGDAERSRGIIDENVALRHRKHPRFEPCAGSYFKNVPPPDPAARRIPAGKLLDECGAKELRVGGAAVFAQHANIIVNAGGATATDVLALAEEMKRRVRERFGIELEEEVTFVPADLSGPAR
jgi:UDP-N-acetylmuramate dehydrogenase